MPGPGAYDPGANVDLSPKGKYVISRMKNCLTRKFNISSRRPLADRSETPGPGIYRVPSDFGHYVSRSAFEGSRS